MNQSVAWTQSESCCPELGCRTLEALNRLRAYLDNVDAATAACGSAASGELQNLDKIIDRLECGL